MKVHHINCGTLHVPPGPVATCHCLLLAHADGGLTLVDTGIGLRDVADPAGRVGPALIAAAGFQFNEADTAVRQIEKLGLRPADVRNVILTHGDPDHSGGLADFPRATVHVSAEELASIRRGHLRYVPAHFDHAPRWLPYPPGPHLWFGLAGRPIELGTEDEVLLVELFGHTRGHCGVAVRLGNRWLLHVGDAYYLRIELSTDDHPVSALTAARADDDGARRASLAQLRRLAHDYSDEITLFGYHDATEIPPSP